MKSISCFQGNESYTGIAARDTANALQVLTAAARGVAATADDKALQLNLIKATQDVVAESAKLINEAKSAVNNPGDPGNQPRLAQVYQGHNNMETVRELINDLNRLQFTIILFFFCIAQQ